MAANPDRRSDARPLHLGLHARETFVVLGPDEFEEVFELAGPGKPFELYSRARLKRVR
jgi:hypothetical protein